MSERWLTPAAFGACAVVPVLLLLAVMPDAAALIGFFPDDAFYYLQPAWQLVERGTLTFDGVNGMTGFHPLHMLVTVGWLAVAGKGYALPVLLLWNALCLGAALALVSETFGLGRREVPWAIVMASPPFTLYLFTNAGLESGTLVLVSAVMMSVSIRAAEQTRWRRRDAVRLGAVMGLWLLARLDMVLPLAVVGSALVVQRRREEWGRAAMGMLVGGLVVVGPYLLWLWHEQGSVVPMSALAKYGRDRWPLAQVLTALTGGRPDGWLLLGLAPAIAVGVLWRPGGTTRAPMLRAWAVAVLVYTAYVIGIAHEPFRWYLVPGTMLSAWLIVARLPSSSLPSVSAGPVIAVLVLNTAMLFGWQRRDTTSGGLYEAAMALNRSLPPGTPIATHDAGVLGFHYHGPVHNLDGLANSRDNWRRYLSREGELAYAEAYQVSLLVLREGQAQRDVFTPVTAQGPAMTIDAGRFGSLLVYRTTRSDVRIPGQP